MGPNPDLPFPSRGLWISYLPLLILVFSNVKTGYTSEN